MAMDVARRRGGPLLQAGMGKRIDDDMIARADKALDHAETGSPAGGKEHGVLHAQEIRDRPLERERVSGAAEERRRAGAVDAILIDRFLGSVLDGGMRAETQIVLRAEIDAGEGGARIVARSAKRAGCLLGGARIGPELVLAAQILPTEETVDAA